MIEAPQLPAGYHLVALDSIDSTNEEAARRAREGAADGTLVWALEQRRGRGRRGRSWSGPRGNLMCSVLLRPTAPPDAAAQLSFVAALAVADSISEWLPPDRQVALKWPNDVLVDGRKVSGILLEAAGGAGHALDWLIVGVGLNLAHHPADSEYPATSLAATGRAPPKPANALAAFCAAFARWRGLWNSEGFRPVREAWLARAYGLDGPVRVRLDRETLDGCFRGIDDAGELVLELPSGRRRRVAAGDVFPTAV